MAARRSCCAIVAHENIEIAVVVEIAHRRAPADGGRDEIGSQLIANIHEYAVARVVEHQLRFCMAGAGPVSIDVVEHVARGQKDVQPAVVIVIHESRAEHAGVKSGVAQFRAEGGVFEHATPKITVEAR